MINPEHVDGIAEKAYGYFNAKYPKEPGWGNLPEFIRSRWRNNVVDADKVRHKVSDVFQEQCVFHAVSDYWAPGQTSWEVAEEARAEAIPETVAEKSQRSKTKRK